MSSQQEQFERNPSAGGERPRGTMVSVRAPVGPYLAAGFVCLFVTAFLIYLEHEFYAAAFAGTAVVLLFVLAATDKITFDGRRIRRTGWVYKLATRSLGVRDRLKVSDVEQVDTQVFRGIRRGGRMIFKFRTSIRGKGTLFVVLSGGRRFREFIRTLLPELKADVLDSRSIELRNYLSNPGDVLLRAITAKIPPSDIIEPSLTIEAKHARSSPAVDASSSLEANTLRQLGNELRLAGNVVRALEAFRRALIIAPADAWLLFDSARCLYSYSGARRDAKLQRRAIALMRLAERRAGQDGELLSLIGESYSQMGDWHRAAVVFRRIAETIGASFRSLRGQAEIALRDGKIAHVIHNFAEANRLSSTASLRRWTQTEVDYFTRLNDDDEYMELEVSRVNLLESLARTRRTALRITLLGALGVMIGVLLPDDLVANIGWAVSFAALAVWAAMLIGRRMLEARIPFDLVEDDRA